MEHELKVIEPYYSAVKRGDKTFEIRNNDRGFQQGDIVNLRLFCPTEKKYIGNEVISKRIVYMTNYNQLPGYVVFSIK